MTSGAFNIEELFSRNDYVLKDGIYVFPGAEKYRDYWGIHTVGTGEEFFDEFLGGRRYKLALEVGAGDGRCTASFARISDQIVALEPSHTALMRLRTKRNIPNATFVESYGSDLPFRNDTFDLLASITVIEHISPRDHVRTLKEWFRVLESGGNLIVQNDASMYRFLELMGVFPKKPDQTHVNMITPRKLRKDLEAVGFDVLHDAYFPFYRFTKAKLPLMDVLSTKGLFVCRKPGV